MLIFKLLRDEFTASGCANLSRSLFRAKVCESQLNGIVKIALFHLLQ